MPTADSFEAPQGQPFDPVLLRSVTEPLAGNGIVSSGDFEVTATATDLGIEVAAGTMFYRASEYTLGAAETHQLSGGDGSNDRWDTVYFDVSAGSSGVREGTPEQYPTAPDIQGDEMLLAIVYVEADATDVVDADVLNWRPMFSNEAEEVHYDDDTGVYGLSNVDAALDELQEAAQISAYPLAIGDLASPYAPASIANVNGYPFQNGDLANDTITANAGTGITTTNANIGLGGSTTLAVDASVVDLEFVRNNDNTITGQLADLPTNPGDFGALINFSVDGNSPQGTVHRYRLRADGISLLIIEAESDGAGGVQNERLRTTAAFQLDTEPSPPPHDGQGSIYYNTDEETLKCADSAGTYQRPVGRPALDQFDKDETGTVQAGNVGVIWFTSLADQETAEVYQAGLLLDDLQPAPSGLDLVLYTGDNGGTAALQTTIISGDGTVQDDVTGSPIASYQNTTGGAQTVAVGVDNGNFGSGTGGDQDIAATFVGEIV
jgi:hypothetical protein